MNYNPFVEIDFNNDNENDDFKKEALEFDEIKKKFFEMKKITRNYSISHLFLNEIFYEQAKFMESFTDNYDKSVGFSAYFPIYNMLGYEQLRTYFTWRTKVRNNIYHETSLSYVFIYIYEVLNNIGCDSPIDGFSKLLNLFENYKNINPVIEKYLIKWIKDYYIYYGLIPSFREITAQNGLKIYYKDSLEYLDDDNYFHLCAKNSPYKITKSLFYQENRRIVEKCFNYCFEALANEFKVKKKSLDNILYTNKNANWIPFESAYFYNYIKSENRVIEISKHETYFLKDNHFRVEKIIFSENGKLVIGYIFKKMEEVLRKLNKFKFNIKTNLKVIKESTLKRLNKYDINLENLIPYYTENFIRLENYKHVDVSIVKIDLIRDDSIQIQEILSENIEEIEEEAIEEEVIEEIRLSDNSCNVWAVFISNLEKVEIEFIKLILENKNVQEFSKKSFIMPSVLIDNINSKSIDIICDLIIDPNTYVIYQDYIDCLKEII